MTALTGIIYPYAITGLAQLFFPYQANGSLVFVDSKLSGSELLAQKFDGPEYFWPRPSAIDYNPLPSSGSNLGPTSADLKQKIEERREKFVETRPGSESLPDELLLASGSGLDPHLSPGAVLYQTERVAVARHLNNAQMQRLVQLVESLVEPPQFGVLGEPRVNVLLLNKILDEMFPLPLP